MAYESENSDRLIFQLYSCSFHQPAAFDIHRDQEKVEKRLKEIKAEIKPFRKDAERIVFASDQSRIVWESLIRKDHGYPKGAKTVIKVERQRRAQLFIGLLNLKTGEELLYRLSRQKQDEIIPVLEALVKKYPDKRICLVWDKARFHHGKKLKAKLSNALRTVHLINLPAYAPDHNPQEKVWK